MTGRSEWEALGGERMPSVSCDKAEMSPALAQFLAWRVDEMYATAIVFRGRPPLDMVVGWCDSIRHALEAHAQGNDPRGGLSPRALAQIDRIREAFERSLEGDKS